MIENKLHPKKIVEELDKYVIGQNDAKKSVAIALRNRWRRQQVTTNIKNEIIPNNIILIGPTGSGKTEISRRLANLSEAPFIKVEASKYTEVGYVGRDVESMIRDLVEIAIKQTKESESKSIQDIAMNRAQDRVLDILLPPLDTTNSDTELKEKQFRSRAIMKEQLLKGELDEREIELEVAAKSNSIQVMAPLGMEDLGSNIQDMLGNLGPKKKKRKKLEIRNAIEILKDEEIDSLIDMDKIVSMAMKSVENNGIVFIDEIDKVANSSKKTGGDVSREGVQRDLLPIVEGTSVNTKHGTVKTDHILFIASGAFHVAKPSDLIPELQGRFPIRVELNALKKEDFIRILTEPENALIKQYAALVDTEGFSVTFKKEAIEEIATLAEIVNKKNENIGARRLHTLLSRLMEEYMFEIPNYEPKKIVITAKNVKDKLNFLVEDEDLSKFIL